jgi:hypothetical protein
MSPENLLSGSFQRALAVKFDPHQLLLDTAGFRRPVLDRPLNKPTQSALFDGNFVGNGATWLILKRQLYIGGVSAR